MIAPILKLCAEKKTLGRKEELDRVIYRVPAACQYFFILRNMGHAFLIEINLFRDKVRISSNEKRALFRGRCNCCSGNMFIDSQKNAKNTCWRWKPRVRCFSILTRHSAWCSFRTKLSNAVFVNKSRIYLCMESVNSVRKIIQNTIVSITCDTKGMNNDSTLFVSVQLKRNSKFISTRVLDRFPKFFTFYMLRFNLFEKPSSFYCITIDQYVDIS